MPLGKPMCDAVGVLLQTLRMSSEEDESHRHSLQSGASPAPKHHHCPHTAVLCDCSAGLHSNRGARDQAQNAAC